MSTTRHSDAKVSVIRAAIAMGFGAKLVAYLCDVPVSTVHMYTRPGPHQRRRQVPPDPALRDQILQLFRRGES